MSSKIKTFDVFLPLIPIMLLFVGISVIYSLVFSMVGSDLVFKQIISSIVGILVFALVAFVDYRFFRGICWIFYAITMLLLVYVDFFGHAAGGAMRWINLGFFQLQPSEVAKAALILTLATFYADKIGRIKWKDIFLAALILILPLGLILKEPDLGTALVLCFIFIVLFLMSRPTKIQLITISALILFFSTSLILSAFKVKPFDLILHDYQRNRILTFLDPNLDPYGTGYNVRQAQITIGSGGILGKGLGRGTQSQLQFLPKPQTDFIFSGVSESFGFVGISIYLFLYAALIFKIINIGNIARDSFGTLICYGIVAMFIFQVLINVGMNLGLAPVTGIPLPFASYGGSALVVYFFLIGLVESVFIRHHKITF